MGEEIADSLDNSLNLVKSNAIEIVQTILPFALVASQSSSSRPQNQSVVQGASAFLIIPMGFTKLMAESLRAYIELRWGEINDGGEGDGEEEGGGPGHGNQRLILLVLGMLTKLAKFREYYTLLSDLKSTVLVDVIAPLMAATEVEKQDLLEDP